MEFTLSIKIEASPEEVYSSWLDSEKHSQMTGGEATISNKIGEHFSAWDGYIEGKNIDLDPNKRILQSWRTGDFEESEKDSVIEILFKDINGQTELTLIHSQLPEHGEQYRKGWEDHYFNPMKEYFSGL